MSKKFSIYKIDTKILIHEISNYLISDTGSINLNTKPYFFMNKDTIDELTSLMGYSPDGLWGSQSSYMCGYLYGCKTFCDNTLSFGEVEIR